MTAAPRQTRAVPDRPKIALTLGRDLPDRSMNLRLPLSLVRALTGAGAVPIAMPPGLDDEMINQVLSGVDGLLLPGGVDPHPRHFSEEVHPETVIDEPLDALELAVITTAMDLRMPILGVCRGCQILNVALGGSLIQHLDTGEVDHRPGLPLNRHVHEIQLAEGSRLRKFAGADRMRVNSLHHQAIARTADSLKVVARSEDGYVEAIESIDPDRWLVGVQYHPEELLEIPAHRDLFTDFIAACAEYGLARVQGESGARRTTAVG
jgi:putative glutamine amidotransferase